MSFYLCRAKLTQDAMDRLVKSPEDRLIAMTRVLKEIGGRLQHYFFSFGDYDIVLLFELPDNVSAASLSMAMSATGSCSDVETTPLLTMPEAVQAMERAGAATGVYVPPGRRKKKKD